MRVRPANPYKIPPSPFLQPPKIRGIFLGNHETIAVNEKNTRVCGNLFEVIDTNIDNIQIRNEIEEMAWISQSNYKDYKWAHLAEEFILPIWLKKQIK